MVKQMLNQAHKEWECVSKPGRAITALNLYLTLVIRKYHCSDVSLFCSEFSLLCSHFSVHRNPYPSQVYNSAGHTYSKEVMTYS